MRQSIPKQYLELQGRSVIENTLATLLEEERISLVTVCVAEDDQFWDKLDYASDSRVSCVVGGATRADSVLNGIKSLHKRASKNDWLLVHDAARPCLSKGMLASFIDELGDDKVGGILALPSNDTVKFAIESSSENKIQETLDRNRIWYAQTPQMFRFGLLRNALESAIASETAVTDEASAMEIAGYKPRLINGEIRNIKITRIDDLEMASLLMAQNDLGRAIVRSRSYTNGKRRTPMKIGHGYDVHQLVVGRKLILGGVDVPHTKGLLGHSDADVVIHSTCDAILGALGQGDIGQHFPDSDSRYAGIESRVLLRHVAELMQQNFYQIGNVDITIVAQAPKLANYLKQMQDNIADDLGAPTNTINLKATTTEKLGFVGEQQGIESHAVVLLNEVTK
ncbi:UNVERIFIED_CONTAM: hypothetical protein GTU68_001335 [Idotea baltica]|nr:hypothetical protein [Idotea baltica]